MGLTLSTIGLIAGLSAAAGLFNTGMSHIQRNTDRNYNSTEAQKLRDHNELEAQKQREFNSAEAQKQRDFEQTMSSTAVQRQMADMKEAGINPTLAASLGGASTPSGGMASAGGTPGGASASSGGGGNLPGIMSSAAQLISAIGSTGPKANDQQHIQKIVSSTLKHMSAENEAYNNNWNKWFK